MSNENGAEQSLIEQLAALKAENEQLKAKKVSPLSCKVSQKGAVSVYGLQRFPVTLYAQQFERLLGHGNAIRQFIADNAGQLTTKD